MRERGVRPDDPEYLKAHQILSAVQRSTAQRQYLAQQQAQLQAHQRQAAQQQQLAAALRVNGTNGKVEFNAIMSIE